MYQLNTYYDLCKTIVEFEHYDFEQKPITHEMYETHEKQKKTGEPGKIE
jgi:hypothetical protein